MLIVIVRGIFNLNKADNAYSCKTAYNYNKKQNANTSTIRIN